MLIRGCSGSGRCERSDPRPGVKSPPKIKSDSKLHTCRLSRITSDAQLHFDGVVSHPGLNNSQPSQLHGIATVGPRKFPLMLKISLSPWKSLKSRTSSTNKSGLDAVTCPLLASICLIFYSNSCWKRISKCEVDSRRLFPF